MFLPAAAPQRAEKTGLTPKNNTKHRAMPALPAKVTANQGQTIIKNVERSTQKSSFFTSSRPFAKFVYENYTPAEKRNQASTGCGAAAFVFRNKLQTGGFLCYNIPTKVRVFV